MMVGEGQSLIELLLSMCYSLGRGERSGSCLGGWTVGGSAGVLASVRQCKLL